MGTRLTATIHDELLELTLRLTAEYQDVPAGSVMRCVSRALLRARLSGTPDRDLPAETEWHTRLLLARRAADAPPRPRINGQDRGSAVRPAGQRAAFAVQEMRRAT